jgi:Flp pilus assembly protein TadD
LLLFAVGLALNAVIAAPPPAKEIAGWIEQLGDNNFAVREAASKKLWAAGSAAESALEAALKSDDAEVVRRARDILDKFKWGIYPDTPVEIVALVQAYQATEGQARREVLQKLLQAGPAGLQTVLKIAKAEKDPNQRRHLGDLVSSKLPVAFRQALEEGKYEQFEKLLELGHDSGVIHHNQYTVYWLLRGKIDERIADFQALLMRSPDEKRFAETLAYLYRARGDLVQARKAAEKSGRDDLLEGILYEAADWKALAARPDPAGVESVIEKTAFRTAYARLAGNPKEYESGVNELKKLADQGPVTEPSRFNIIKALLLNDRPADGLQLLETAPARQLIRFEILFARSKYREALALVDQPRPAESQEQKKLEVLKARTLFFLGETDKARELFGRLAGQIKDDVDPEWVAELIGTEYRLGLVDAAFNHLAQLQSIAAKGDDTQAKGQLPQSYLNRVFPDRAETAEVWWGFLRSKFKEERPASILKRLRDLMDGKLPAKEVKAWIEEAERRRVPANPGPATAKTDQEARAMAEAAAKAGLDDLAYSLLEKAGTPESLLRLGDLLAARKRWTRAAKYYREAWRKGSTIHQPASMDKSADPLPLFLAGDALVKAGQDKEGRKLKEQAHWALLGDALGRFAFLTSLMQRGHKEAAQRETELLRCASEPNSYHAGAALRRLAVAAAAHKEYVTAAEGYEQSMLRCLHSYTSFVQASAYAMVPAQIHQVRASALLAAGKYEEAARQIDLALACTPGNVELAIHLVPQLEQRGRKKEAAALFDRCFETYDKVCRDYPRCAWAHNSAAWMSACCRRNLDKALEHAERAVQLAPTHAGYLDTLAEVQFQRGEKDKAVALQKRVIELDPKKVYFQKQLRRLEAGNPAAERPAEDED